MEIIMTRTVEATPMSLIPVSRQIKIKKYIQFSLLYVSYRNATIYLITGGRKLLLRMSDSFLCRSVGCLMLIIIVCRCLCVQYRILLMLPLFLINKCTEAVIMADIACISVSHVSVPELDTSGRGPGKFVQSSAAV